MTFGSLFAGIGGIDLGLERAGMQCKWQVEIDDYAGRVLAKHWPEVQRFKDVKQFPVDSEGTLAACQDQVAKELRVDLIAAGFPCQDISNAGKKRIGLAGERSGLYFDVLRVAGLLRPRYLLLENVAALLVRGFELVLGTLAEIGFDAEWHCLQAADFGAPHIRDRVFIIAHAQGKRSRAGRSRRSASSHEGQPKIPSDGRQLSVERSELFGQWIGRMQRHCDASRWSTAPRVLRMDDGIPDRVDRVRSLGNSVVPQIAECIGQSIIARELSLQR